MGLIDKFPQSWTDCGMDWDDPDPTDASYYLAIYYALFERMALVQPYRLSDYDNWRILLTLRKGNKASYIDALQYIGGAVQSSLFKKYIDKDILRNEYKAVSAVGDFNGFAFSHNGGVFVSNYILHANNDIKDSQIAKMYLKAYKNLIDKCTVISGTDRYGVTGFSAKEHGSASVYVSKDELLQNLVTKLNTSYKEALDAAVLYAQNSHDMWFELHATESLQCSYAIARENNFPWTSTDMTIQRGGFVIASKESLPYTPNVHLIVQRDDNSYNRITDTGLPQIYESVSGGLSKNFGMSFFENYITSFKGVHVVEPCSISDISTNDTTIPPQFTKGYSTYTCSGYDVVTVYFDFNCEGGFKFRPDDTN